MKALLLIDIQNDFLEAGALAVPAGNEIIPTCNRLQAFFDLVIATQDWHPSDHKSFAANHPGKQLFEKIEIDGLEQVLWPNHCVQSTFGAELSQQLDQNKIEAIFRKGTDTEIDSYSAFYDNGHRKSTGLAEYLRGKNIVEVYMVGLAADYCVYYSMLDSIKEGFDTVLVEDATRAINQEAFLQIKGDIKARGARIIRSQEVLSIVNSC